MATDRSPSVERVIVVHDPRLRDPSVCLWAAQSSYTQAGPQPGVPEAQGDYETVLQSGGSQSAAKLLRIQGWRGGHPVAEDDGGLIWQYSGDAGWRGWDPPNVSVAWEAVVYSAGADATRDPHMLALPDGQLLCTYEATSNAVRTTRRTIAGTWTAPITVYTPAVNPTYAMRPCLCLLPDESVLLFHWVEDQVVQESQVRVWRSTDKGDSWTMVQPYALQEWSLAFGLLNGKDTTAWYHAGGATGIGKTGAVPGRLRAIYHAGTLALFAGARLNDTTATNKNRDVLVQFASDSLGKRFSHIYTGSKTVAAEFGALPDLVVSGGMIHLIYIGATQLEGTLNTRKLPSAFVRYIDVTQEEITDAENLGDLSALPRTMDDADSAACADDTGTLYAIARQVATAPAATDGALDVLRSTDIGATWRFMGRSSDSGPLSELHGIVAYSGSVNGATHLRGLSMAAQRGRLVLAHNWDSVVGTYDDSLGMLYLGGYTNVTMPGFKSFGLSQDRVGWERWWAAIDLPVNCGWALAGAGTETLQAPGELNVATIAQARSYSIAPAGTDIEGITVASELKVNSGGSLGTAGVALRVRVSGTNRYQVTLRFSGAGLRVWDDIAGAQVGSDFTAIAPSAGIQILVSLAAATVSVWARPKDASSDRSWSTVVNAGAVASAAASTALVEWGHVQVDTADSDWTWLQVANDNWNGAGLHGGFVNPDDLWARAASRELVAIDDGVKLRTIDGPVRRGDLWSVDTRYDFPIERIFPMESRSPRVRWRSTGTTEARIALALDEGLLGTVESRIGSDLIGLCLMGINWRLGKLQYYDVDTAAWITVATIDAATGRSVVRAVRRGATIVPDDDNQEFYAFTNDFANGTFHFGSTGGGAVYRKILWHPEGQWSDTYAGRKLDIHLSGVVAGDPTGTTDASIWSPNIVVLVNMLGVRAAAWRLVIDSQGTVDGHFEIGTAMIGPAYVLGTEYGKGRVVLAERGWEREEADDRTSRTREHAPDPRVVEVQWADGVDTSNVFGADPDYVTASATGGAEPVASRFGTPWEMHALARLTRGHPVVLCHRYPRSAGAGTDVVHLTRPHEFLYGVLDEDVQLTQLEGEEFGSTDGEILQVGTLRVREEV